MKQLKRILIKSKKDEGGKKSSTKIVKIKILKTLLEKSDSIPHNFTKTNHFLLNN